MQAPGSNKPKKAGLFSKLFGMGRSILNVVAPQSGVADAVNTIAGIGPGALNFGKELAVDTIDKVANKAKDKAMGALDLYLKKKVGQIQDATAPSGKSAK